MFPLKAALKLSTVPSMFEQTQVMQKSERAGAVPCPLSTSSKSQIALTLRRRERWAQLLRHQWAMPSKSQLPWYCMGSYPHSGQLEALFF
jgi:hypothetical protein